jgi:serine/threonine protein kinase
MAPAETSDNPPILAADGVTTGYQPDQTAGTMVGRYKLLQPMGEGGMGAVWMAEQRAPVQRRVAVKIIKASLHGDHVLARFEAERQALAMMDHPNIARVFDAGTTEAGRPYFVMELVKGVPFHKYCDRENLPLKERLELFIPVCNAVQHAHQKGIVHRDLKPSNVLVALYDGKPVPKVIDFGVAKAITQKLTEKTMFTEVGQIVGTLEYMAPEQAELNNLDIDTRADIYSLGVMLYELLTGAPPFTAKELRNAGFVEMLRVIREVEPTRPSTKLSSSGELDTIAARRRLDARSLSRLVRGDLDWIVMKCIEKERGRRYETASQVGEELRRFLAHEPVLAGPPSATYRARKFLRRNKGAVIAAALVVLALFGGMVGTSAGMIIADRERDLAEKAAAAEKEASDRAQANERIAIEQADLALDAIGEMIMEVQQELQDTPGARAAQLAILRKATSELTRLVNVPATSDKYLRRHALGHLQLGRAAWQIGDLPAAQKEFELALDFAQKAMAANPTSDKAQFNWAAILGDVGRLQEFHLRRLDRAREHYEAAIRALLALQKRLRDLPQGDPNLPAAERMELRSVEETLAYSYDLQGRTYYSGFDPRTRDFEKARRCFEQALEIRQRHLAADPDVATRGGLALS